MIEAINLHNLRNAEFIQYFKNFSSILSRNNPLALLIHPKYEVILLKIIEMEGLFKTATANPMTAEMEELDFRRDQAINGIIANINSFSYHFDEILRNAADILQNNLKLYGTGIAKEGYQSETAIINKLIKDWENKPELAAAINALNLNAWITELKTVNMDFDQKYVDRARDYAAASPDNLKGKRAEAMTVYYELRNHINAYSTLQSSPVYDKVIGELNALIEQYNLVLKGRAKRKKTADKDATSLN